MKRAKQIFVTFGLMTATVSTQVAALPSEELIGQYNLAAQGNEEKVEQVYQQLNKLIELEGADALSMVYLGSTQTLMGRDAWMPWNKMKYTEQGLATISKGLDLIQSEPKAISDQVYRQGLPENQLAQAIAGATYTSLPDMFNHFERGYEIYLDLLANQEFTNQHYDATAWIYIYAIKAALRAEDSEQAKEWLTQMKQKNARHPMTAEAQALIDNAA